MIIPIHFHYQYTEYKFSARATKYSKLQGMAKIFGWAVGTIIYLLLMMLVDDELVVLIGLIPAVIVGVLFTRWFRSAMGRKVEAALKEDMPAMRPKNADIPAAEDGGSICAEPVSTMQQAKEDEPPALECSVWLVCSGGYMKGRIYPITAEKPITLGRLPGNLLQFPADYPGISREHARLSLENGKLLLTDLGSTDGTVIFGRGQLTPMVPQEMTPGDVFYIGTEENAFEIRA